MPTSRRQDGYVEWIIVPIWREYLDHITHWSEAFLRCALIVYAAFCNWTRSRLVCEKILTTDDLLSAAGA